MAELTWKAHGLNPARFGNVDVYRFTVTNIGTSGTGGTITHGGPLGVAPLDVWIQPTTAFSATNHTRVAWTASDTAAGTITLIPRVRNGGSILAGNYEVMIVFPQVADQDGGSLPY